MNSKLLAGLSSETYSHPIGMIVIDWIHMAQDGGRWWCFVTKVMNIRVPCRPANVLTTWSTATFPRTLLHITGRLWQANVAISGSMCQAFLQSSNADNPYGLRTVLFGFEPVLEMGRYVPVHHTATSFCSWISYRHLSIYTVSIYLFPFLWRYIFVSLLRSIPALLNVHFGYCFEPVTVISCCMFWEACTNVYIECLTMSVNVTQFVHLAVQGSECYSSSSLDSTWKMMWSQWRRGPQAWHYVPDTDLYC
jgi:hypothetical protein